MIDYPRILFPLDLSHAAPKVAKHVVSVAQKYDAQVHVVYVIPSYHGPTFPSYDKVMGEIKERTITAIDDFVDEHLQDLARIEVHVAIGHTGRRILAYVDKHDISLVIMGTHGHSGVGKLFFGSVAQRVVQSSPVPVMTVHPVEAKTAD